MERLQWGLGATWGLRNPEQKEGTPAQRSPPSPFPPERGLHMSLPLRSSASGAAGASVPARVLRNGDSTAAPGAGGSSSSLEGELEGELE